MPEELKYTLEEVHEMHKRILLNFMFSRHRDNGPMINATDIEVACDDVERLVKELESRGLIKEPK